MVCVCVWAVPLFFSLHCCCDRGQYEGVWGVESFERSGTGMYVLSVRSAAVHGVGAKGSGNSGSFSLFLSFFSFPFPPLFFCHLASAHLHPCIIGICAQGPIMRAGWQGKTFMIACCRHWQRRFGVSGVFLFFFSVLDIDMVVIFFVSFLCCCWRYPGGKPPLAQAFMFKKMAAVRALFTCHSIFSMP